MASSRDSYLEFGPYQELLAGIRTALTVNEGIIKLVGPEGAGKSALCRQLAVDLVANNQDVVFFDTPPESEEFLQRRIQSKLGLAKEKNFNRELTQYLLAKSPPHRKLTIVYDDAERISKDIFIFIRLLNNIHDDSETLVSQIICGTPKLDERFDDPELRSLTQYLNQSFTLAPMTREQLEDFCAGYIKMHDLQASRFSNRDITDIFMQSEGMPGKSLALLEKHFGTGVAQARTEEMAVEQEVQAGPEESQAMDETPVEDEEYAREVNEILKEDPGERRSFSPVYFKAALSILVLVATIVLMIVLSGDDEPVNVAVTQVEEEVTPVVEDDTPVYLDEVDETVPVEQDTVTAENTGGTAEVTLPVLATATDETGITEVEGENDTLQDSVDAQKEPLPSPDLIVTAENTETVTNEIAGPPEEEVAAGTPAEEKGETLAAVNVVPETVADDTPDEEPEQTDDISPAAIEEVAETTPPEIDTAEPSLEQTLSNAIARWVNAWQHGDFDGYLAAYDENFDPAYEDSREAWEDNRRVRIDGVEGMAISFDSLELLETGEDEALVRFWLYYSRAAYADETWKEVQFQQRGDDWLILSERNLRIVTPDG